MIDRILQNNWAIGSKNYKAKQMLTTQTTDGALYLIGVDTGQQLSIQFVPKDLEFTRTVNMQTIQIIGRNNPLYQYTGGEDELSIELDFYSLLSNREDVYKRVNWLRKNTMNNGFNSPPENLRLVFGKLFRKQDVWGIKSLSYKFSNFNKPNGYLPQQAYVNITLGLDTPTNSTYDDVDTYGDPFLME